MEKPEPPFKIGTENAARAGWRAFFEGRKRNECPFPDERGDLKKEYQRGWDAAEQWKPDPDIDEKDREIFERFKAQGGRAYTPLTDAQRERVEMLIDEAAEVIRLGAKMLRNGRDRYHPNDPPSETNEKKLKEELLDLFTVAERMMFHRDIDQIDFFHSGRVWKRKLKWTRFQPKFSDPLKRDPDE